MAYFSNENCTMISCASLAQVHTAGLMGQVGFNNWFLRIFWYFCSRQAAGLLWAPAAFCLLVLSSDLRKDVFALWYHLKQAWSATCSLLVTCVMSYRLERPAAEGANGRMGHFSWFFFSPLFPCSNFSRDTSPVQERASDCCAAICEVLSSSVLCAVSGS